MSTPMTTPTTAAPVAIHSVTPMIDVPDGGKLIDFLKRVFDAEVTAMHAHGPGDAFHAFVSIGGTPILIGGGHARELHPAALHVFVKDCDAVYQSALEAGAVTLMPGVGEPADRPYGERSAFVKDIFENQYFIGTRPGASYLPEGSAHVVPCLHPAKAAPLVDFLERAFGARESDRVEMGGRLMHSFLRIGETTFELGESDQGARASAFYMYTDDVDAVYHRAMAAGARSLLPPTDQFYGDRIAVVEDPVGNQWVPAKHIKDIGV